VVDPEIPVQNVPSKNPGAMPVSRPIVPESVCLSVLVRKKKV